jgi:hypothetical protein
MSETYICKIDNISVKMPFYIKIKHLSESGSHIYLSSDMKNFGEANIEAVGGWPVEGVIILIFANYKKAN